VNTEGKEIEDKNEDVKHMGVENLAGGTTPNPSVNSHWPRRWLPEHAAVRHRFRPATSSMGLLYCCYCWITSCSYTHDI